MPTIGWIDALRTYNAGMPSWCVPRKGTPGYERVMRIRQGEQTKGFKEVLADLERKTSGKPKKEKKSLTIDLDTQSTTVPTIPDGSPKTEVPVKKSSVSNNKKAMAVVPVNYVAEGGAKEVAEGGAKSADQVRRSQLIKERDELRHDMSARNRRGRIPNLEQDHKNERKLADLTNEIRAIDRRMKKEAKEEEVAEGGAKEGPKEDAKLPPLLSGTKDGEENSKHLAVLQEAAKEGRLYQLHGITRRGTVETPVFLRQGDDYHKIAVIALGRTTFPEEPHSVYFQPITRRIVLTEKEAKAKGMAKFHSKI